MSTIDRQRIQGVRVLQALGYVFDGANWQSPSTTTETAVAGYLIAQADAMHSLLVLPTDKIEGFREGSEEETEYMLIAETLEDYEAKRWPSGRTLNGKG